MVRVTTAYTTLRCCQKFQGCVCLLHQTPTNSNRCLATLWHLLMTDPSSFAIREVAHHVPQMVSVQVFMPEKSSHLPSQRRLRSAQLAEWLQQQKLPLESLPLTESTARSGTYVHVCHLTLRCSMMPVNIKSLSRSKMELSKAASVRC